MNREDIKKHPRLLGQELQTKHMAKEEAHG
jgi:hypothetical protein